MLRKLILQPTFTKSLKHNIINKTVFLFVNTRRTQLHNINFITCSKAEILRPMIQKIDPSPAFYKITQQCDNVYELFMTPKRTYLPNDI